MNNTNVAEYIKQTVYPSLDAVESGFLSEFSPTPNKSGKSYSLVCPHCHQEQAFYYKNSGYIHCSKKSGCGTRVDILDYLAKKTDNDQAAHQLCRATSIEFPGKKALQLSQQKQQSKKLKHDEATIKRLFFSAIKRQLAESPLALNFLQEQGWDLEEIKQAPFGYIKHNSDIEKIMTEAGAHADVIHDWGILEYQMENSLVGGWEQPDGSLKLWGWCLNSERKHKPLVYQKGFNKSIPFLLNTFSNSNSKPLIMVDSPLDAARLKANNIGAIALGSNSVISDQIRTIAQKGQQHHYIHWVTKDGVGRQGAEKSILTLSELGIDISVFEVEKTWVSAFSTIGNMPIEKIQDNLDNHLQSGGQFLAERLIKQLKRSGSKQATQQKIISWSRQLSGQNAVDFQQTLLAENVEIKVDVSQALKTLANLLDAGVDTVEALKLVNNQYQLSIQL